MNTNERMKELYTNTFDNIHVSHEYSRKVINMAETKRRVLPEVKVLAVVAAILAIITAGSVITFANRGVYDKVIFNGEERNARFCDFGDGVRLWEVTNNNTSYSVYTYGDFDTENDTLYFVDKGDYFLASTNSNPTLNIYDEIDNSPYAKFIKSNSETCLALNSSENSSETVNFSEDAEDGVLDGKFKIDDNFCETWAVLPNGSIVNTIKEPLESEKENDEMWKVLWSENKNDRWKLW